MKMTSQSGLNDGCSFSENLEQNVIGMLIQGEAYLTIGKTRKVLGEDAIFVMARGLEFKMELMPYARLFMFHFDFLCPCCDRELCDYETGNPTIPMSDFNVIPMPVAIKSYAKLLMAYGGNITEPLILGMKMCELYYLLKEALHIHSLASFLKPSRHGYDIRFHHAVLDNVDANNSVGKLASACGYSLTAFNTKFRKEFKVSPGTWLNAYRKQKLLQMLKNPEMQFSDIALALNMSSVQHFSRYCRTNFGCTPSQLRAEMLKKPQPNP